MNDFDKELDAELIEKLFPAFPRERFEALVEKVRKSMIERIRKNRWLSAKGKKAALEKMESASMQLVKPRNDAEWDFLPTRSYDRKAYIANRKSRDLVRIDRLVEEFGKPRNRERWTMAPLTVNAYYSPADNKFVMLQGILQFPFFDAGLSDAANLGAAGVVVGHELGHAIDDQGSKYDAKGRLRRWMTPEDLKTFQRLAASLVAQYDAAGHDGSLTLGENIADVTGLSFAYGAAFPNNEGTPEEKQAFFIQYGRAWCGTMRPAERVRRLKTDPHAQTETRVNEPLKHQPGFYEAFGCKVGDKMYLPPEKRLSLW